MHGNVKLLKLSLSFFLFFIFLFFLFPFSFCSRTPSSLQHWLTGSFFFDHYVNGIGTAKASFWDEMPGAGTHYQDYYPVYTPSSTWI